MATIYDVAKAAGVSASTVSRVINSPENVSEKTRKLIESTMRELDYVPNSIAQGLTNGETNTIGLLLSDVRNLHFAEYVTNLEQKLFDYGYNTLLCSAGDQPQKRNEYLRFMASRKVDGLIILGSIFDTQETRKALARYLPDIPTVTSNMAPQHSRCCSVQLDQRHGMELVLQHLYARGFRDIRFLYANDSPNTKRKIAGFEQAMRQFELPYDISVNLIRTSHSPQGGRDSISALMPTLKERVALVYMEDIIAIGAVVELQKRGVQIPQQVGVVGYDNSVFSICCDPQLTTVNTKIPEISEIMANSMHNLLEHRAVGQNIVVYPELVIRGTT